PRALRVLASFPTRRSSDLRGLGPVARPVRIDFAGNVPDPESLAGAGALVAGRRPHRARHLAGLERPAGRRVGGLAHAWRLDRRGDRKSTRLNSSHVKISYA